MTRPFPPPLKRLTSACLCLKGCVHHVSGLVGGYREVDEVRVRPCWC